MQAYAMGHLTGVHMGSDILTYLERIDATLAPFDGKFLVHGDRPVVLEGALKGDFVMIAFPDMERARAWYASAAYQAILPLRTNNARSTVFLLQGVSDGHMATDILS